MFHIKYGREDKTPLSIKQIYAGLSNAIAIFTQRITVPLDSHNTHRQTEHPRHG